MYILFTILIVIASVLLILLVLVQNSKGGDLQLEGEIVGYQLTPMAISADTYASQTKLTITINVRFLDSSSPEGKWEEKKYSAYQTFDSNSLLTDVQDELLKTMIDEITDQIYNDTVAKW